jgi:hypothetical protein
MMQYRIQSAPALAYIETLPLPFRERGLMLLHRYIMVMRILWVERRASLELEDFISGDYRANQFPISLVGPRNGQPIRLLSPYFI